LEDLLEVGIIEHVGDLTEFSNAGDEVRCDGCRGRVGFFLTNVCSSGGQGKVSGDGGVQCRRLSVTEALRVLKYLLCDPDFEELGQDRLIGLPPPNVFGKVVGKDSLTD
jgi:hypothetical protein